MALEPSLWGTLPEELLHLVFVRLPIAGIGQLRVLSKEWKRNIDYKYSTFNRVFDATAHLKMFALMSWGVVGKFFGRLYDMQADVQADKWHVFRNNTDYTPVIKTSTADGGLFCSPWQWRNAEGHLRMVVVNPLTQRKMKLPALLSKETGNSDVGVEMMQLTVDRKTKEFKLRVVGYMETRDNGLFAQVYDSHINRWSVVESREGRIIGWEQSDHYMYPTSRICVYNYADGNLQHFSPSDIAPGFTVEPDCIELINDHLFVLHEVAPPGSTNLMQDGESISGKYCISEFHLPEKATAWVKLGVHECDPSIYDSPKENYELILLACNGFLLVRAKEYWREYDRVWLYNLSTRAWRNLPELGSPRHHTMVMLEISWSAQP